MPDNIGRACRLPVISESVLVKIEHIRLHNTFALANTSAQTINLRSGTAARNSTSVKKKRKNGARDLSCGRVESNPFSCVISKARKKATLIFAALPPLLGEYQHVHIVSWSRVVLDRLKSGTDGAIQALARWPRLVLLEISHCALNAIDFHAISSLTMLRTLTLSGQFKADIPLDSVSVLTPLTELETLKLDLTDRRTRLPIIHRSLAHVSALAQACKQLASIHVALWDLASPIFCPPVRHVRDLSLKSPSDLVDVTVVAATLRRQFPLLSNFCVEGGRADLRQQWDEMRSQVLIQNIAVVVSMTSRPVSSRPIRDLS
ncbi:hypothetical protein B0H19DRAFT_1073506 [Mycena capillaripes]|nr:hypothetical protein B0H19DRAFT_1073506 [Mycena capillaripes]